MNVGKAKHSIKCDFVQPSSCLELYCSTLSFLTYIMRIQGYNACAIDCLMAIKGVSTAPPLGRVFEVKSSKIPCIPPPLPVQGVVGHAIDRCISFTQSWEGLEMRLATSGFDLNFTIVPI